MIVFLGDWATILDGVDQLIPAQTDPHLRIDVMFQMAERYKTREILDFLILDSKNKLISKYTAANRYILVGKMEALQRTIGDVILQGSLLRISPLHSY